MKALKLVNNNHISMNLYLSKIENSIHVAIDGCVDDLDRFGISAMKLSQIGDEIESVIQRILIKP